MLQMNQQFNIHLMTYATVYKLHRREKTAKHGCMRSEETAEVFAVYTKFVKYVSFEARL